MDNSKIKSLSLNKLKISEADETTKERRVTFVASTSKEDRDFEVVEIETFRLPLKGGGEIRVSDLPTGGSDNVDIPFLTNHELWSVENTIGSVRNAKFENGQLIFECGISSREYAQDMFKLIEEGHLDNSFSIQFRDYDWNQDTDHLSNGEIVEVSLVTRGSNKDAQVLEVKQMKGKTMDPESNQPAEVQQDTQAPAEPTNATDSESQQEPAKADEPQAEDDNNNEDKEKSMDTDNTKHTELAAKQVKEPGTAPELPSQKAVSAKSTKGYLDSKEAVLDYARMAKKCMGDADLTNEMWREHLGAKGVTITGQDSFLPTRVEQVMFKAWHDAVGALQTFRRTSAKAFKFYAMTTTSTALGHKKGDKKADQDLVAIPRNGGLKVIYKKLPIDWIDIVNDESGDLYIFRTRELTDRVLHAIVEGAILGDGMTEPATGQPDYLYFDGVNGLYSMVGDLNGSSTAGSYASAVATVIANVDSDDTRAKIVKTLSKVNVNDGERKVLVVAEGTLEEMLLEKNSVGGYMYSMDTDFAKVFNVSYIVEFPAEKMAAAGYDVIAYKDQAYTLGGPEATVRNWFDGEYNKDIMMVERPVLGSLEGSKVVAGYASK